jgi:hypothetical protein
LGIGEVSLGGYRVNFTRDQLDTAPKYTESQGWNWSRENDRRVYEYYRAYAALFFIGTKSVTNHAVNLPTPLALVATVALNQSCFRHWPACPHLPARQANHVGRVFAEP